MSENYIPRSSLQAEVVTRLRSEIVEGEWRPGVRLQERLLCERYGISRSPLREAYQVLASEGLIELSANRGAVVSTPTPQLTVQFYELLRALELLAIRLACQNASAADIEQICQAEEEMRAASQANDLRGFFRSNNMVHRRIVLASGNVPLADAHLMASRQIVRLQNLGGPLEHVIEEGIGEHDDIIAAIKHRDVAKAENLFSRHLDTVEDNIHSRLAKFSATLIFENNNIS